MNIDMRVVLLGGLLSFTSAPTAADPHYVQVLHPYWGNDEAYALYLEKFTAEVDSDVRTFTETEPEGTTVYYIYEYSVAMSAAREFSLEISCPGESRRIYRVSDGEREVAQLMDVVSDPVHENPRPYITEDGNITWPLNENGGRQAMWFYSLRDPVPRSWRVVTAHGPVEGQVNGPSCQTDE